MPSAGDQDRLEYEGTVELAANGAARLSLRAALPRQIRDPLARWADQVPEGRLHEVIETRLLGQALPGAELIDYSVEAEQDLDVPLIVEMQASLGRFARCAPTAR